MPGPLDLVTFVDAANQHVEAERLGSRGGGLPADGC